MNSPSFAPAPRLGFFCGGDVTIAVGREEMVYPLSIIPVAFLVYCLA
jgi:hypothetical protein